MAMSMATRTWSVVLAVAAMAVLAGCPQGNEGKKGAPAAQTACTKVGQSCEVTPGKLGTCVVRDGCTEANCFVCQSQH